MEIILCKAFQNVRGGLEEVLMTCTFLRFFPRKRPKGLCMWVLQAVPYLSMFFWISFLHGTDLPRVVQGVYWLEGKDDFVTILCRLKLENSVVAMFEKFNSREKRKCPRLFVNGLRKNSKNWYPPFSKMKGAIRKSIAILIVTCYVLRLIFSGHLLESSANTLYTKTPPNFHWFLQVVIIHNLFLITGYPWVKFGEKFCVSFLLRLFVCLFVCWTMPDSLT